MIPRANITIKEMIGPANVYFYTNTSICFGIRRRPPRPICTASDYSATNTERHSRVVGTILLQLHLEYRTAYINSIEHGLRTNGLRSVLIADKYYHDVGGVGVDLREMVDISGRYSAMYDAE